jgi:2,4-dienoyl-CoA reductase-like NADH-dependent reductase (Old Yellow Enzyme family)/thioredoxin reductase
MRLQKLLEPTRIGTMPVKNRIVMPPMDTNLGTSDGFVTTQLIDYYQERARGGVGLIIVECTSIEYPRGKVSVGQLSIDDDKYLDGLSRLASAIKEGGARAAIQLEHGGGVTHSSTTGHPPMGPSVAISPLGEPVGEMSVAQIDELVGRHADAADRAKRAGFEGVEIHGAHEHLLAQFISPSVNQREDGYGGSLENRARFLLEVIRACRAAVGPDYPLWCRIDGAEYGVYPAIDRLDAGQIARWSQEAGVDAVHVSGHGFGTDFVALCPGMPGLHLVGAAEARRNVTVPVIAVGRIYPELGEWALREGIADLIAMGRALIADPYLPTKAAEGRLDDVVPCIGCWECVEAAIQATIQALMDPNSTNKGDLECSVNPAVGRERECFIGPARSSRRVVVVGGGPAGMEAARVARLRGHDVTLMERDILLGGQLVPAAIPPRKQGISLLIDYLSTQLSKLNVKVELGKEATLETLGDAAPDAVVWAAGATPVIPDIDGIDDVNAVLAADVLAGRVQVGDSVVIIGAELVGCETANVLAQVGKKVTVVRRGPQVMAKVGFAVQAPLLEALSRRGVELLAGVKYEGFGPGGLAITTDAGARRVLGADTYILAAGARSNSELVATLRERFENVDVIGDALEPRRIRHALVEGLEAGNRI